LEIAEKLPADQIFIVPLRLDECQVPTELSVWQWVDYFDGRVPEQLVQVLQKRAEEAAQAQSQPQAKLHQPPPANPEANASTEIDHLKALLETNRSALLWLRKQVAMIGEAFAPVEKLLDITNREKEIRRIKARMRALGVPYTNAYVDGTDRTEPGTSLMKPG
jgi:hypothetical protein